MPLIFFFIIGVWVVFWVISAVYVYSVGEATRSTTNPVFAEMKWNNVTRYVWIYHLFGLFWISAFIIGAAQFIIATCCALWYFSHGGKSDDKNQGGLGTGVKWLFRYHLGTIAFGSLIIAIMQMIKLAFEYLRKKYEKLIGDSMIMKCLICSLRCCIWCVDSCVKHITKNAYIQTALTGNHFCGSAWATFWLIVRNAARFSMTSMVGGLLMFVGKGTILVLSGWIGYLIIVNSSVLKDKVAAPIFPVVVIIIIAYLISSIFLSIFSFSAETILHCFLVDSEISAKNGVSNVHTPQSLLPFLELTDKQLKAIQGEKNVETKPN